jgi:hypothetical protein
MLVRLDAREGFVRGAERLQRMASGVDPYVVTTFLETSREFFGATNLSELIQQLPEIVRVFLDRRSEGPAAGAAAPAQPPSLPDSWEEFVSQWRAKRTAAVRWGHGLARGWATHATKLELERAADDVRRDADDDSIMLALEAFQRAPWPASPEGLMRLADSGHPRKVRLSISALAKLPADAEIREFAWARLTTGGHADFARLLANNLAAGDGVRLATLLPTLMPGNAEVRHDAALATLEGFAECKMPDEGLPIWSWIYEHSPCSQCRLHAVEHMVSDGTMPSGWIEECRWDSNEEITRFVSLNGDDS